MRIAKQSVQKPENWCITLKARRHKEVLMKEFVLMGFTVKIWCIEVALREGRPRKILLLTKSKGLLIPKFWVGCATDFMLDVQYWSDTLWYLTWHWDSVQKNNRHQVVGLFASSAILGKQKGIFLIVFRWEPPWTLFARLCQPVKNF